MIRRGPRVAPFSFPNHFPPDRIFLLKEAMKTQFHPYRRRMQRLRPLIFRISLILVLALMLLAFNWTSRRPPTAKFPVGQVFVFDFEQVPPTVQARKKPQPPRPPAPAREVLPVPAVQPAEQLPLEVTEVLPDPVLTGSGQAGPVPSAPEAPPPPLPEREEGPVVFAQHMPVFGDCHGSSEERRACTERELLRFLQQHLRYPPLARANGIEGMVVVRFVIGKDGRVRDAEVLRDIGGGCGAEALRVTRLLPDWKPGRQQGRPVAVWYTLPVRFELADE